jgi:hypothetical protein
MKLFILGLLISNFSYAWTLNNNFGAYFKDSQVKVYVDESTVCDTNQVTYSELEGLIRPAVDDFWNKIPTTNLNLIPAGFSAPITTINKGRLCSPTDDECIEEGTNAGNDDTPADGLIPAVNDIVIACNSNPLNFGGGNVLAVTIPNKFSGKKIVGAIILINDSSNTFGSLSRSDQIAVIAHEIGHALGLGHSEDQSALMYYRTVQLRQALGQDDIDGISYLYPIGGDLYGLSDDGIISCGTVTSNQTPPSDSPPLQMGITFGSLIVIFEILKLFNRPKTRTTP